MGKSAPDVPQVNNVLNAQTGTSIGMSNLNAKQGHVQQVTPYGKVTLRKKGTMKYTDPVTGEKYKIPKFKEVVKLSPEGQKQFDLQQGTITNLLGLANEQTGRLGEYMGQSFSLGDFDFGADLGVGAYQPGQSLDTEAYSGDPLKLGNEATEARLYELGSARLDPRFARERENLQSELMSRGIREGTAAWDAAMGNLNQSKNDAYNQLLLTGRGQAADEAMAEWQAGLTGQGQRFNQLLQSRGLGMAEQGQQFSQTLADRQRLLAERGQQTQEAFAQRSQPINEIAALLGMGQVTVPQSTGYQPTGIPITDAAGIINKNYDQQLQAWQAEQAAMGSLFGGLMGGIGNIFGSDRRIKDNVDPVGETETGLPIYEFTIGDGPTQTGVLAQDVEDVNPEAVIETPSGVKAVDYAAAVGDGTGTYTVQRGDTLWDIGQRFNVPYQEIAAINSIANPDRIQPGQELTIPGLALPGPEAVPYDPMSESFGVPANSSVESVAEALMPAADNIDMLTMTDEAGNYLMPQDTGFVRPEFPGALPAAPQPAYSPVVAGRHEVVGSLPAASMGGTVSPSNPYGDPYIDLTMEMERRFGPENVQGTPRFPAASGSLPASPPTAPEPIVGTPEAGSTTGEFFTNDAYPDQPLPEYTIDQRFGGSFDPDMAAQVQALGNLNGAQFPAQQQPAVIGTPEAGSTTGEFFSPPPPGYTLTPEDPLSGRVSQAFDMPAPRAEIMDLLGAFQRRNMMSGFAPAIGGF